MGLGDFWGGGLGLDLPSSGGVGAKGFDNFSASLTKRARRGCTNGCGGAMWAIFLEF